MERHISVDDAGERFAEVVRDVQDGESFVVTSSGIAVAKIVPTRRDAMVQELALQAERIAKAFEAVDREPIQVIGPWKREDLYD